jgi:hypothetical protein
MIETVSKVLEDVYSILNITMACLRRLTTGGHSTE